MYSDDNHTEDGNGSNSTNPTRAETIGAIRALLDRLEEDDDEDYQCQARVDETGRFWLQDPANDEAYLWSRQTIDVEVVR
ncbi:hypothetical protein RBH26_21010 [Natronolimnohabitans sp. A-GB9]|uniref:hypothetical protein n=1 Tax=Natronolimnohabitans sp. A-GB9 TaxID=3069757 RepID=UPI0027B7F799|nr:hypothetical protein [Natronolimnohabitans sp. A-GB9]MDQ2052925.1 hypothetical protein [Natronolimnohabitans sp. A-GB9]